MACPSAPDPAIDGLGRPGVRWVGTTQSSMGWDDPACGIDRLVTASQQALQTCSEMQIPISIPSVENRRNAKHQISTRTTTVIQGNTGPNAPNVNIAIPWVDLTSDCAIRYPRIGNPANTGNVYTSAGMKCKIAKSGPNIWSSAKLNTQMSRSAILAVTAGIGRSGGGGGGVCR